MSLAILPAKKVYTVDLTPVELADNKTYYICPDSKTFSQFRPEVVNQWIAALTTKTLDPVGEAYGMFASINKLSTYLEPDHIARHPFFKKTLDAVMFSGNFIDLSCTCRIYTTDLTLIVTLLRKIHQNLKKPSYLAGRKYKGVFATRLTPCGYFESDHGVCAVSNMENGQLSPGTNDYHRSVAQGKLLGHSDTHSSAEIFETVIQKVLAHAKEKGWN